MIPVWCYEGKKKLMITVFSFGYNDRTTNYTILHSKETETPGTCFSFLLRTEKILQCLCKRLYIFDIMDTE